MLYSLSVQPCSVEVGGECYLQISPLPSFKISSVSWVLSRLTCFQQEYRGSITSFHVSENNSLVNISLGDFLLPGIYKIDEITLNRDTGPGAGTSETASEPVLFEIRKKGQMPKEPGEISAIYNNLQNVFKQQYLKGIGVGEKSYSVVLVIEGIITYGYMQLGTCNIQPIENNTPACIKGFMDLLSSSTQNSYAVHFYNDSFHKQYYGIPGALKYTAVHYPFVNADDGEKAQVFAEKEVELMLRLLDLSLIRGCRVLGAYVTNGNGETVYRERALPSLNNMPDMPVPFDLMYVINARLKDIRSSDRLQLILSLYKDAAQEENIDLKYYKYLHCLFSVTKERNYTPWNCTKGKNINRMPELNEKEVLTALIKQSMKISDTDKGRSAVCNWEKNIEELTSYWFQRRDCLFAEDNCLCRNPGLEDYSEEKLKCRRKSVAVEEMLYGADIHLRLMEHIAQIVVLNELKLNNCPR